MYLSNFRIETLNGHMPRVGFLNANNSSSLGHGLAWSQCPYNIRRSSCHLFVTVLSSRGFMVYFNLRINKKGLVIYTHNYTLYYRVIPLLISDHRFVHIWATKTCWHCCEWVPGLCPKVDCFTFTPDTWLGTLPRVYTLVAWLGFPPLGLPRSCCRSEVPNLKHL